MVHRYNAVVDLIRKQIDAGTLKVGDRLPSIRQLSQLTGFSTVTVCHGYELLESQGVCTARPRSGYFVARMPMQLGDFPTDEENQVEPLPIQDIPQDLLPSWRKKQPIAFASPYPSPDLFDCTELDVIMRRVLRGRTKQDNGPVGGNIELRLEIAKRLAQRGIICRFEEIVITGTAIQSLNLCLDALTEPGDIVLVESPSYPQMLASIKQRNLRVLEIYSHPRTGTDPDQFEYLVRNNPIRAAILMPNHQIPSGTYYSDHAMRRIVLAARENGTTIIENDMLADLRYSNEKPSSLKQFDPDDSVLQFGSFEYTLSAEYGHGWVIAGKHTRRLLAAAYLGGHLANDDRRQGVVADFLRNRGHSRQSRRLRENLAQRMNHGLQLLADNMPSGCGISRPTGGFLCWIRVPRPFAVGAIAPALYKQDIGILPGPLFSATRSFENFFALNLSFPWTEANTGKILKLAEMTAKAVKG